MLQLQKLTKLYSILPRQTFVSVIPYIKNKKRINDEMEKIKQHEKKKMNELKNQLFEETRKQQQIQAENELISSKISILEQDFEIEIQKKN